MPTTNDDDIELTEYADGSGATGDGSETYLLMELEGSNTVKSGYIRLGGVDPAVKAKHQTLASGGRSRGRHEQKKGEDLAAEVLTFIDDSRIRGPADEGRQHGRGGQQVPYPQPDRPSDRDTIPCTPRGGWRDHTKATDHDHPR